MGRSSGNTMKKDRKITDLKWGLFSFRGKNFLNNLADTRVYFKRKKFLKEHGYPEPATYEMWMWFITVMKDILTWYRYNRHGTPWIIDAYPNEYETQNVVSEINDKAWNDELDKMIDLLEKMNIDNLNTGSNALKAKDEFFKMFSKYFYEFWD